MSRTLHDFGISAGAAYHTVFASRLARHKGDEMNALIQTGRSPSLPGRVGATAGSLSIFRSVLLILITLVTNIQDANWGAFKKDHCTGAGFRQYSSRLWNISGD